MADDTRDPREDALRSLSYDGSVRSLSDALARLDAADPIRKLWPEVVEALDALVREFKVPEGREPHLYFRTWRAASEVLTRARAITPEGGDHG